MVWNSVGDFLAMGGYGLYVWGSVAVTFGLMLAEVMILKPRHRAAMKQIERYRLAVETERADEASGSGAGSNAS